MPYIKQEDRNGFHQALALMPLIHTPGELNYLISKLLFSYAHHSGLSYQKINDIIGALEGAKLEFYRRVAVPYEESKIKLNGDVYNA